MTPNDYGVTETAHGEDGKLILRRSQDVTDLIRWNKFEAENAPSMRGQAAVRKIGSIPLVVAEDWSRECGYPIGTSGFADYARRKLMSGEFAAFRIK